MNSYLAPFKKYAVFSGRARRKELWTFNLVNIAIYFGLALAYNGTESEAIVWVIVGLAAVVIIPTIAVTVRRLHDTGRSGAWYFLTFIPLIGGIWLLILLVGQGTRGANQYGPDPLTARA